LIINHKGHKKHKKYLPQKFIYQSLSVLSVIFVIFVVNFFPLSTFSFSFDVGAPGAWGRINAFPRFLVEMHQLSLYMCIFE
jgi:hypothetical protein